MIRPMRAYAPPSILMVNRGSPDVASSALGGPRESRGWKVAHGAPNSSTDKRLGIARVVDAPRARSDATGVRGERQFRVGHLDYDASVLGHRRDGLHHKPDHRG